MSTKKLHRHSRGRCCPLGLLAHFGGHCGLRFYSIGNSEAAAVSKDFLQKNEQYKQDIGEVKSWQFVTGSITSPIATDKPPESLKYWRTPHGQRYGRASLSWWPAWRVTAASYTNEAGQTVDLLRPYETQRLITLQVA